MWFRASVMAAALGVAGCASADGLADDHEAFRADTIARIEVQNSSRVRILEPHLYRHADRTVLVGRVLRWPSGPGVTLLTGHIDLRVEHPAGECFTLSEIPLWKDRKPRRYLRKASFTVDLGSPPPAGSVLYLRYHQGAHLSENDPAP